MKLLRLTPALKSTSASYNQFSLGFKDLIDQTIVSLPKHQVIIDKKIKVFHGNNSILKMCMVLRGLVAKNKYDIVHIHNGLTGIIFLLSIFPFRLNLLKKTVFTLHNSWQVIKLRNQILNFFVMVLCKRVVTCGMSSHHSIPKTINYFIGKKTIAIVNGFNHKRIDNIENKKLDKSHFGNKAKIKIVYAGAFNNTKNQMALLKALKKNQINAEIIFLGDGSNKKLSMDYSSLIPDPTVVTFKGLISRDAAIEHMLEADIFISLSKGEGMPIAVLEAMYAGCFMILSTIPPHKEVAPPSERCLFVNYTKTDEIVNSLNYVSDNIEEIRCGRKISKEHSVNNFSLNNMLESYKKVYDSICEEHI
ncbi:MAG: glycosyltransferase family 4 protein [Gammaproteobacteria bacterium]